MNTYLRGLLLAVCCGAGSAQALDFKVIFEDAAGVGFNSTEPFAGHGANHATTLGEARRNVLFRAIDMIRSQVHGDGTVVWRVRFQDKAGYLAVTLGPVFSELTAMVAPEQNVSHFPFEVGRHYPTTLMLGLTSRTQSYGDDSGEDATTSFSNFGSYYGYDTNGPSHSFIAVVVHELVHVLGFADRKCLGNCIPAPSSKPTHFSKYVFGEGKSVDDMSIAELDLLYVSHDKLWFTGSAHTQQAAIKQLTGGHTNGSLHLHAEAPYDGQNGAHFAPTMYPAQLMYSAGANTTEFGMAAYVLCDIGWCANTGEVQDMAVTINASPLSSDEPAVISGYLENASDYPMPKPELLVQLPVGMQLKTTSAGCVSEPVTPTQVQLRCQFDSLGARQQQAFQATVQASKGEYTLYGRGYINAYAVDPNGVNNIVDMTLSVIDRAPLTVSLGADVQAVAGSDVRLTAQASGGSGNYQYQWQQTAGPAVSLTAVNGSASFIAPDVSSNTNLVFRTTVTDGTHSQTDDITVTITAKAKPVEPTPPSKPSSGGGAIGGLGWLCGILLWRWGKWGNRNVRSDLSK